MATPDAKRKAVANACTVHAVSQRRACLALTIEPPRFVGGSNSLRGWAMISKTTNKFSPEVGARAVRMVLDHAAEHA